MNELQDIFESYLINTPEGNDFDILQKYIEKYPHYEKEMLEFVKERSLLKFDLETEIPMEEQTNFAEKSRRNFEKFWANKQTQTQSIESLTAKAKQLKMKKQEFAKRIGLNPAQLFNLEIRSYIFSTIPNSLIETVAETLQTTKETIADFLRQSPSLAANFKSQTRPDEVKQISFVQAINDDETLSEADKQRLLNLK